MRMGVCECELSVRLCLMLNHAREFESDKRMLDYTAYVSMHRTLMCSDVLHTERFLTLI